MITLTIIIGVICLLAGHLAGLTETKLGTGALTAIILLFAISALPQCYWLFDEPVGWLTTLALWFTAAAFYHRLLADNRRNVATSAGTRRHAIVCQFGRQRLGFAFVWSVA
jgi:hypothetical protein